MPLRTMGRAHRWCRARHWGAYAGTLIVLSSFAQSANAATPINSYAYTTSFGDGLNGGTVQAFNGVTVEGGTGNIIVPEAINTSVSIYAPDPALGGVPLTTFANTSGSGSATNVASDPSNGSLYLVDGFFGGISKWVSDGAPTPTYTLDNTFSAPFVLGGIAVDPVTHDVLVSDLNTTVSRLDAVTGAVLSTFDGSDTRGGTFANTGALAVGPTGTVYVQDFGRPRVERMSPSGAAQGALPLAEGAKAIGVAADGQSGEVHVLESLTAGGYQLEGFTPAGDRVYRTGVPGVVAGTPVGIAVDPTTHRLHLADDTGTVYVFDPAIQPGLDAPAVSQIAGDHVHVSAAVAAGGETTTARIEYCPAPADCSAYAASDPLDPSNPWIREPTHANLGQTGDPADVETIADDLTGLTPNTAYRVRVHAENARTENTSAVTTFTTALVPPEVETGPASDVKATSAVLTGTIATIGDQTTYHFEYGLTDAYGSSAPAGAEGVAGDDRDPRTFTRSITGLMPGTTYHYRLVARNSGGQAAGADRTFTTSAGDALSRGYEQVTPVDKRGASVQTIVGFHAAPDGSGLEYIAMQAPADADSAPQAARLMSRRGASDWSGWTRLDPPMAVGRGITSSLTLAVSSDFDHTMVVSNRALTPGAVEQGANIYVVDVRTGAYTLVGTSTAPSAFNSMAGLGKANMFYAGAPDFSWIVFASEVPLLPGVTTRAIYRWSKGSGLTLESRMPDGTAPTTATSGRATRQVSDDGETTYFSLSPGAQTGVYRRAGGVTKPISVSQRAGDPPGAQFGTLDGSSSDGRYAFFHGLQLTDDAPPGFNLYRYDAVTDDLTFIAPLSFDYGNATTTNDVPGIGADGRTVYYHSGSHTMVWHDGQQHEVDAVAVPYLFPSRNGRYVTYQRGLGTGDVRLYDVARQQGSCISCPVDGAAGAGDPRLPLPERTISNRLPLTVTDDGLALFDTRARLVTADHNGARDVYAYKDGTLTLISPGDQAFDARYADASDDGHDVFFGTAQPLVGRDDDQAADLYDARIGGGLPDQSPPPPPAACSKDDCSEPTAGPVTSPSGVTPPDPPGPPRKRTDEKRVTVKLAQVRFTSTSVHVRFRASEQGRVRVTGSRVRTTVRNVLKAGTYTIVVPLSKKARALRHDHRKFKVAVKVTLTGGWGSASAKYSRTLGK